MVAYCRDNLISHMRDVMTAFTPGSAPDPTLGNEYRRTLPFVHYRLNFDVTLFFVLVFVYN